MQRFLFAAAISALLTCTPLPGRAQGILPPNQNGPQQALTLPDGVDHIYALEGTNQLVVFGTQEGYETTWELVKALDGDLEMMRTEVTYAQATPGFLAALGVTVGANGTLSASDIQSLVYARRSGAFTGTDTLRITGREEYVIKGRLGGGTSALPLAEATEVDPEGRIQVRLMQPLHVTVTLNPGELSVVALPPTGPAAPISLLFLKATTLNDSD